MKFSNDEKKLAEFILMYRNVLNETIAGEKTANCLVDNTNWDKNLEVFKFILVDHAKDAKCKEKIVELLKYINKMELVDYFHKWAIPNFPITGEMLIERGVKKGPIFTKILNSLKDAWKFEYLLDTSAQTVQSLLKRCETLTK